MPVPEQSLALVEDQVTVNCCPTVTVFGVMEIVAVGAGGGNTVTVTALDVALGPGVAGRGCT